MVTCSRSENCRINWLKMLIILFIIFTWGTDKSNAMHSVHGHEGRATSYISDGRTSRGDEEPTTAHKTWTCSIYKKPENAIIPPTKDWNQEGFVTPVKKQGSCNSCYAFSAAGSVEGQLKKVCGTLNELSKQQIVDCSTDFYNNLCQGGDVLFSFRYLNFVGGIMLESAYPYIAKSGTCRFDSNKIVAIVEGCRQIQSGNEEDLKVAVALEGPISVSIDHFHASFRNYKGGIYEERNCKKDSGDLNHSMLLVGYGTENGRDYWLLKNSQGTKWGINGYMKLLRNANNMCGIATQALFPILRTNE